MAVEKLAVVPPEWAKIHRTSANAMLRAEAKAAQRIKSVVREIHVSAAPINATQLHQAIRSGHVAMRYAVTNVVVESRKAARSVAIDRVAASLKLLAKQADIDPIPTPPQSAGTADHTYGEIVGASLSSAWATAMLASQTNPQINPLAVMRPRIERIATTEVARAYSNEHDEGIGYALTVYRAARWFAALFKRWDATLDRATCSVCNGHDGELAVPLTEFSGGDKPAEVHVSCRCMDSIVFLPGRIPEGVSGAYTGLDDGEP